MAVQRPVWISTSGLHGHVPSSRVVRLTTGTLGRNVGSGPGWRCDGLHKGLPTPTARVLVADCPFPLRKRAPLDPESLSQPRNGDEPSLLARGCHPCTTSRRCRL